MTTSEKKDGISKQGHHSCHSICSVDLELCDFINSSRVISEVEFEKYEKSFPLVYSMMKLQDVRTTCLEKDGLAQSQCTKSNEGWIRSIFIWKARSLESIVGVWTLVMLHSVVYTLILEFVTGHSPQQLTTWQSYFSILLNMTLGLLLVFRLNRAATRWWIAREYWGLIVANVRSLAGGIVVHGDHLPGCRDDCLRWLAAMVVSVVEFLHGTEVLDPDLFAGILSKEQVLVLENNRHPPLFAAQQARYHLAGIFSVSAIQPATAFSILSTQNQIFLETQLNSIATYCGGLERIKATPLPIVYVSHLRTFLLISLLLFPYMWGPTLGWSVIPVSAITAFALLGIESCSAEVESPFGKNRPNALNMNGYVIGALGNILQIMKQHADRKLTKTALHQNTIEISSASHSKKG